jgi:hypothetical protein
MQPSDDVNSSAIHDRRLPADPLAEFYPERRVPIRPAIVRTNARPVDTRRASPVPVASAASRAASETRASVRSFALGSVFGAVLCVIVVYVLTMSDLPRPEPVARAAAEMPPAAESPIVLAAEPRDTPSVEKPIPAPALPPRRREVSRQADRVAAASPSRELAVRPFVGSLQIDSMPQGARVFIDRRPVGVTPLVVTDLAAGSHAVRVEADGHTPWSSAIRVIANRQTEVNTILMPLLGSIRLRP